MSRAFHRMVWLVPCIALLLCTMRCNPDDDERGNGGLAGQDDPLQPKPAVTTTVTGLITDESGKPVTGAEINVHGEATITNDDGTFLLENIQVPGNRVVIHSKKEGYFSGIRALTPRENSQTETRIVLMTSPVTHTFEASAGSNATLPDGSEVRIPSNGLVTGTGEAYSGPVSMSVRYMDPTAGNFGVLVPGGDMLAQREDNSTSILYSYGILRVQMTDANGDNLQLAPGSTSTLMMNIPAEQLSTAPEEIPLWFFDEERGVWQEDGSARREGNRYIGTVSHFTDWNCDDPKEGATIVGRLIDCNGNPAWGIVEFGQITSDPQSSTESGESDGRFERRVPDGIELTVVISDPLIISPLTKNERGKVIVIVPPLAPGQVYDVGDIQTFPCPSEVTATFKTQSDDEVLFAVFSSQFGSKSIYSPGSSMRVNLPPDMDISLMLYTARGISVTQELRTAEENGIVDLGEIDLTSENTGFGQIKGKIICYGAIENEGQISVTWTDPDANTKINYTSPEADGTFIIDAPVNTSVEVSIGTGSGAWQKTAQTPSATGEVLDLGTIEICDNARVGETSFRITGDGLNNQLFTVLSNENTEMMNMGAYYPFDDVTLAVVDDLADEIYMGFIFPGNTTGVRDQTDEVAITIERKISNSTIFYWSGGLAGAPGDVKINITKYEAVGGVIEGTFSGTFQVQDVNKAPTGATVKITEGKFSVLRYPDAE